MANTKRGEVSPDIILKLAIHWEQRGLKTFVAIVLLDWKDVVVHNRVIQLHSQNWSSKEKGLKNSGSDSRRIKRLKDNSSCTDQMYFYKDATCLSTLIQRPVVKLTTNDAPPSMTTSHLSPHNVCRILAQQSLSCLLPCNQINQWCRLDSLLQWNAKSTSEGLNDSIYSDIVKIFLFV